MPDASLPSALLPAPTGPVTAMKRPGPISRSMSLSVSAVEPGYRKQTPRIDSEAGAWPVRLGSGLGIFVPATYAELNDDQRGSVAIGSGAVSRSRSRA